MPLVDIPTQGGLICSWRSLLATKIQKTKLMLFLNYWWPIVFHCFRLEKLSASSTLNENISCFLFCLAAKYLLVNTHNQLIIRKPVWVAHSFEFPSALNGSVDPFSFDLLIVPYILSGGQPGSLMFRTARLSLSGVITVVHLVQILSDEIKEMKKCRGPKQADMDSTKQGDK